MKKVFLGLFLAMSFVSLAQNSPKEVLFSIDDKAYYSDEFERVYKKNLDLVKDESQKDLNQYLDLYVGYKLKVTKANTLGLQNNVKYQNELKSYRNQLSKSYTSDSKVTSALVKEGYDRMKKEIRASHILILVDENASPEDTLIAYKKIQDVRKKAINGEDFSTLAQEFSEEPSARESKGDLGYFSSFRMIYAFENFAFNTPVGQISKAFRTRFGYHVIKVFDIRDNRGEVAVAHIMLMNNKEGATVESIQANINDIYKKIQQGESFEELAKQFSEDKSSSSKGGVLTKFGSGQLSSQLFEDVAFSLSKDNPISKPFQSEFGWHIVKFIDRFPLKSLEESKADLEAKIARDDRSRLITNSLTEKLRKRYTIKRNDKVYAAVAKLVTNDFYESKWDLPEDKKLYANLNLFTLEKRTVTAEDFLLFVKTQQKAGNTLKPISKLVDVMYTKFVDEQMNSYYDSNLEVEFPEFGAVVEEYRDGLLLFDLMEKEIWERSKTDTLGLKSFYEMHKDSYRWKTRLDVTTISSTKEDVVKKALAIMKKGSNADAIKEKLNTKEVVNVMVTDAVVEFDAPTLPKGTKAEVGFSDVTKKGEYYFATHVKKVLPEGIKSFEEAKSKAVNEYQQYLEQNWVSELKKEFQVKVNKDVFEKVKNKLAKKS